VLGRLTNLQSGVGLRRHCRGCGGLACDRGYDRIRVELVRNLDDLGGALAHHAEQALHLGGCIATQMKCVIGALLEVFLDALEESVVDEGGDRAVAVDRLGLQERVELALGEHDKAAELIDVEADALRQVDADLLGLAHVRGSVVVHAQGLRGTFEGGALAARLATLVRRIACDRVAHFADAEVERDLGRLLRAAQLAAQPAGIGVRARQRAVEREDDGVDDRCLACARGALDEEEA
jgi:hypothetical protein